MAIAKNANLSVSLFMELAAVAAFCFWGFHAGNNTLAHVVFGIGAPLLMILFWGMFMAPRSTRRFSGAAYVTGQIVVFGLAAVGLAVAGQHVLAVVFAVVAAINITLARVWRQ